MKKLLSVMLVLSLIFPEVGFAVSTRTFRHTRFYKLDGTYIHTKDRGILKDIDYIQTREEIEKAEDGVFRWELKRVFLKTEADLGLNQTKVNTPYIEAENGEETTVRHRVICGKKRIIIEEKTYLENEKLRPGKQIIAPTVSCIKTIRDTQSENARKRAEEDERLKPVRQENKRNGQARTKARNTFEDEVVMHAAKATEARIAREAEEARKAEEKRIKALANEKERNGQAKAKARNAFEYEVVMHAAKATEARIAREAEEARIAREERKYRKGKRNFNRKLKNDNEKIILEDELSTARLSLQLEKKRRKIAETKLKKERKNKKAIILEEILKLQEEIKKNKENCKKEMENAV